MDRSAFGKLITALRKQSYNSKGKTWSRQEFGRAIKMPPAKVGRLERGMHQYLDMETLGLMADAFQLTPHERKEFLYAAISAGQEDYFSPDAESGPSLDLLTSALTGLKVPVFVLDVYSDYMLISDAMLALYGFNSGYIDYMKQTFAGSNLISLIYDPVSPIRKVFESNFEENALRNLQYFRRASLRYRHTPYFEALLAKLAKLPDFARHWRIVGNREIYGDKNYGSYQIPHRCVGLMEFTFFESIVTTADGDLHVVYYLPTNKETAKYFFNLCLETGNRMIRFASWPEKHLPS